MPDTGWQYSPYQSVTDPLGSQTSNPNFRSDNGNATASSPFLSAALSRSSTDTLTSLSGVGGNWATTAQNITSADQQAANNQTALLAQKNAETAFKSQQARLQQLINQAQKQGDEAQARAYASEQSLMGAYNMGTVNSSPQGQGPVQGATGVSASGRNQLATADADGYPLSSSNYDRTYRYNSAYSADRNAALSNAYSWLGTHYVLDGETKQVGVDCSGLVQSVYSQLGYSIPYHSAEWEKDNVPGVRTAFSNLQPGDLVCWKDGSHIAIYAGNGEIIEAANTRVGTVRRALWCDPSEVVGIHLTFPDERNSAKGSSGGRGNVAN